MATQNRRRSRKAKKAATSPETLRAAAAKANLALAESGKSILSLPYDVERMISRQLIDDGNLSSRPSISYRLSAKHQRHHELDLTFHDLYKRMSPLVKVCKQTRVSSYEFVGENATLVEGNSNR